MKKLIATITIGLLISILFVNLTFTASFAAKRVESGHGFSFRCGPLINYTLHIENTCCWGEIVLNEGPSRVDRYCQTCTYLYPTPGSGVQTGGIIECSEPTKQKISEEDKEAIEPVTPPKSNEDDFSNDDKSIGQNPIKDLSPSSSSSSNSDNPELGNSDLGINFQENNDSGGSNSKGSNSTKG